MENIFSDEYTQLMFNAFKMISDSCHQQDKKLQSALSSLDVHPAQYTSLFIICTNEGLNLRELAEKMHVENSTASVTVRRMEKSGLIKRQADAEDNRMVRLFVTELGWQQFAKAKEIVSAHVLHSFSQFSEEELSTIIRLLRKLSGAGSAPQQSIRAFA